MPGPMLHSPAAVVRQLLYDLGLAGASWPAKVAAMPSLPDQCMALVNTVGRKQGRVQWDGEVQGTHGVQVLVRSGSPSPGAAQADAVAKTLDAVTRVEVVVESKRYTVQSLHRSGGVIPMGKEEGTQRTVHSVNFLVSVRMVLVPDTALLANDEDGALLVNDEDGELLYA